MLLPIFPAEPAGDVGRLLMASTAKENIFYNAFSYSLLSFSFKSI